jgi:hypothetical protein
VIGRPSTAELAERQKLVDELRAERADLQSRILAYLRGIKSLKEQSGEPWGIGEEESHNGLVALVEGGEGIRGLNVSTRGLRLLADRLGVQR